jgi:phosphoglycolate phosphatase
MITGVLFDLDGVILDCMVPMRDAFIKKVEELSASVTDEGRRTVGANLGAILTNHSSKFAGAVFIWRLSKFLGVPYYKRMILIPLSYYALRRIAFNCNVFSDAPEVLEALRRNGIKMAIVTSRSRKEVMPLLKKFGIESYFNVIVTRDDIRSGKPSPEPLVFAIGRMGLRPNETVMIGDMPTDILAGKKAGTKTMGMSESIFQTELLLAKPDILIDSLKDIPKALESL